MPTAMLAGGERMEKAAFTQKLVEFVLRVVQDLVETSVGQSTHLLVAIKPWIVSHRHGRSDSLQSDCCNYRI